MKNKELNIYDVDKVLEIMGENFRTLILHTQFHKKLKEPWEAVPNKRIIPKAKSQKGKTPSEAIHKLLLEINKINGNEK